MSNVWVCRSCGGERGVVCDPNVPWDRDALPMTDARPVEMVCGDCGASWSTTWQRMMREAGG